MKNLFWILIISLFLGACSSNDTQFTIHGNIEDLPDGQVKLSNIVNDELSAVDSTESIDGAFHFTGNIESPDLYLLTFADTRQNIQLFVDNLYDKENYISQVLSTFKIYTSVYNFIKKRITQNFNILKDFVEMLKIYKYMKTSEDRFGMEVNMLNLFKLTKI